MTLFPSSTTTHPSSTHSSADHSEMETVRELDCLIKKHLVESQEGDDNGLPVAPVSASDRHAWSKQVGVELKVVDARLATICDQLEAPENEHWVIPRYRMKTTK